MTNKHLDALVEAGTITGYSYFNVDDEGNENASSNFRNSETVVLKFNDGKVLRLDTFCSGSSENVNFVMEVGEK